LKDKVAEAEKNLIIAKNTCTPGDAAPTPVDAQTQLAEGANSKAVAELSEWRDLVNGEKRTKFGYDKLDEAAKKNYVKGEEASAAEEKDEDDKEKAAAGFDKLTTE